MLGLSVTTRILLFTGATDMRKGFDGLSALLTSAGEDQSWLASEWQESDVMKKENIGSSFDSFLEDEGIKEKVELRAQKAIIARRGRSGTLQDDSDAVGNGTSRTVVHRLLDPTDTSVTLATLARASKRWAWPFCASPTRKLELSADALVQRSMRETALQVAEPSRHNLRKRSSRVRSPSLLEKKKSVVEGTRVRRVNRGDGPGLASTRQTPTTARPARAERKSKQRSPKHISSR